MSAVYGLELADLPDGCIPIEAYVIVRALDEDGHMNTFIRQTPGLSEPERVGLLTIALGIESKEATSGWINDAVDEDDDEGS